MSKYDAVLSGNCGKVSEELDTARQFEDVKQLSGLLLGGVELKSVIAEGGMGTVYKAFHQRLNLPVAVKILKRGCEADLPMFLREAQLTVSIDHPNLVRVYDLNVDPVSGLHYMVMEYVEGCSAYQLLERQMKNNFRPLSATSVLEIGLAVARALGAAHAKDVVHRDVKSDNILIRARDGAVKLADLGLAGTFKATVSGGHARLTTMAGTIGFISPEVVAGEPITPAADVYGLGATLYELLTGTLPHGSPFDDSYYSRQLRDKPDDPRLHKPDLSADVVAFLARCIERHPTDRFRDGDEAAAALEPLLHSLTGQRGMTSESAEQRTRPVVLCVDDDQDILNLERDTLEAENFTTVCINNPLVALQRISEIRPDVAIIDLNMPGMSGIELCQRLRALEGFQDLGVIILSGEGQTHVMNHAFRKGITDYLLKPLNLPELVLRLNLLTQLRATESKKKLIETQLMRLKRLPTRAAFKAAGAREPKLVGSPA